MNDPSKTGNMTEHGLSFYSEMLGGRLHFLHFETRNIGSAIDMLSSTSVTENIRTIGCTGGGAHKFAQEFEENLDIKFQVKASNFLIMPLTRTYHPTAVFYHPHVLEPYCLAIYA
jgi:pantothenate kinase